MLPFSILKQLLLVLTRRGGLERRHHAEPGIDQIVLATEELVSDEGSGVNITIRLRSLLELEHARFQHAARVIPNTGAAEIEHREDAIKFTAQHRQRFEICNRLLDPRRFGRLGQLLEQRQPVSVLLLRCRE